MCGIFAYIGKRNDAANIVLEGLKRLEYRGYDSWGIAVKNVKRFDIEKHVGKIGVAHTILPLSNFGIGHTRWATHGGVTDFNAHPHLDCTKTISIVHNGIVENNDVLKKKLIAKGHKFLSETDTEVISHLIEENKKNNSFEEAVTKSFKELDGLNAIVAADSETNEAEIGPYKHFMIKEIHEQPRIIRNITKSYEKEIKLLSEVIYKAQGTFFIGAGTAYHACLAGAYLFAKISNIHINTAPASEFNYLESFLTKKSLVIALSQSGETIDVIEPLNRAKQKGAKIAVLTNVLGSTIYRMSDFKMLLSAGPEKAVASTKAYIAKLTILLMLSFSMIGKIDRAKDLLLAAADEIDRLISDKSIEEIKALAKLLSNSEHVYTIGRGASYPTALEAALKIKEVSYIHTEGLAGGELKHGTIALIEKGTPCIVFVAENNEKE